MGKDGGLMALCEQIRITQRRRRILTEYGVEVLKAVIAVLGIIGFISLLLFT